MKASVIQKAESPQDLSTVIANAVETDYKSPPNVGVSTQLELDKLQKSSNPARARLVLEFRKDCSTFLSSMSKKLVERSPMNYEVVQQVILRLPFFMLIFYLFIYFYI